MKALKRIVLRSLVAIRILGFLTTVGIQGPALVKFIQGDECKTSVVLVSTHPQCVNHSNSI